MKKVLQLCLAAALAFGGQAAHAALIDNSQTVDVSATLNLGGSFAFPRQVLTAADALGEGNNFFNDHYTFTLNTPSLTSAYMTSTLYQSGKGLEITGFNLFRADGTLVYEGSLLDPADQTWAFAGDDALTSGKYFLEVSGYATAVDASYGGTLAVAAVPEPGSLALMLGGLAVLGVVARRRA